jgi:aspartyl protease
MSAIQAKSAASILNGPRVCLTRRAFLLLLSAIPACAQEPSPIAHKVPQSELAKIPLIKKNDLYYVQAKINGTPATLLVDTGASITLLNRKFSGLAAGLVRSDVRGVGTTTKGQRVRVRLDIGPRPFMADAVVGDFQIVDADGSLGSDVLAACGTITFDYVNEVLVLYRADKDKK